MLDAAHDGVTALMRAIAGIQAYNAAVSQAATVASPLSSRAASDLHTTARAAVVPARQVWLAGALPGVVQPADVLEPSPRTPRSIQAESHSTAGAEPVSSPSTPIRQLPRASTAPGRSLRHSVEAPYALTGSQAPQWRPSRRVVARPGGPAPALGPGGPAGSGWEINDFSYENLLELGSMAVCVGLTAQQIARLPRLRHSAVRTGRGGPVECTVCLEPPQCDDVVVPLPCGHVFHEGCIVPWLRKNPRCPSCRHEVGRSKVVYAEF
eukprot:EG_transcript_21868